MGRPKIDKTGEIAFNNSGQQMKIVEYVTNKEIYIKFLGYQNIIKATYNNFKNGRISNPFSKTVKGIGYLGVGKYKTKEFGKETKVYSTWKHMISRCYDKNRHSNSFNDRVYKDVVVCEEWHNFQNFGEWFDRNYYEIEGEMMELDKDILLKGNKIYCQQFCVFVPKSINSIFTNATKNRGEHPIGVWKHKNRFECGCRNIFKNKQVFLGSFLTPDQAFQAYRDYKEKYIKEVAEHYKDKIPKKLYEAMYKYEVEITD